MFSLPIRITLISLSTALGLYQLSQGEFFGYVWLAAAILLVVGYFRYGSIRPAFRAMQRGNHKKAQTLIQTIRFPNLLNAQSIAYLHWIKAVLAMQDPSDLTYAEKEIRLAIAGKLRTSNDRCLAMATLACIVYQNSGIELAQVILDEAESIPHRDTTSLYLQQLKDAWVEANEGQNE